MAFKNRIRLPFKITRPQFSEERGSFRKANGETKTQYVAVSKTYEGETDWLPENIHQSLKIALAHDNVTIEGEKYLGGVSEQGDYDIQWQDFLDYPTAKAKFKVGVTPFAATNTNCQSCEEATQLHLENSVFLDAYDDNLDLEEDTEYVLNVADNDEICCFPAVFSVISFNSTFLSSATIDQSGILTIHTKTPLQDATNVLLVTYRVACPNGGYDEANVYGNISGSIPAVCDVPENLEMDIISTIGATVTWEAPATPPANGYIWELYDITAGGPAVQTGTTTDLFVNLTGLTAGHDYEFFVKSDCGGDQSDFVSIDFTTVEEGQTSGCGNYQLFNDSLDYTQYAEVTYMNCQGNYHTQRIYGQETLTVCAAQLSPGDVIYMNAVDNGNHYILSITYLGLC